MSAATTIVNILVPRTLTWDKLFALVLYSMGETRQRFGTLKTAMESGVRIIFEDQDNWPADFVDCDVLEKYNATRQYKSASDKATALYPELAHIPSMDCLVERINFNNENGELKKGKDSLVALIRQLFSVGAANPSADRRLKVIASLWPYASMIIEAARKDPEAIATMENPFTLRSMQVAFGILGLDDSVQQQLVKSIEALLAEAQQSQKTAKEIAEQLMPKKTFQVPVVGASNAREAHWIETDNTRVPAEYLKHNKHIVLLVNRRRSGHMAIFCRGAQDFARLASAVDRADPDRWYLQAPGGGKSPMLLNGSTSRAVDPTRLKRNELIETIQQNFEFKPRRRNG